MKRHAAHDRLLALKLQGATHLARVIETHPNDAVRLKAAMALARLAIPNLPASSADEELDASVPAPPERPHARPVPVAPRQPPAPSAAHAIRSPTLADISRLLSAHTTAEITSPVVQATVAAIRAGASIDTDSG